MGMTLNMELRNKIDALIAADAMRQAQDSKIDTLTSGTKRSESMAKNILYSKREPVYQILDGLTDDELAYVMALTLFGRSDGEAGKGATLQESLDDARQHMNSDGRDATISYIGAKPFSRYLPAGLKRAAGLD